MSQKSTDTASAEALLRSVRDAHSATSADRERVRRALARRLAQSANMPVSAGKALPNAAAFSSWLKLGFVLLLATGSALTILRYSATPKAATSADLQQPVAATGAAHILTPSSELPAVSPEPPKAPNPSSASVPTTSSRNPLISSARTMPLAARDAATHQHVANARKATQTPVPAEETSSQNAPEEHVAPPPAAAERRTSAAATSPTPAKSTTTRPTSAELVFLKRIQAALHENDLQDALDLSQEHERRWPEGMFAQERDGLRAIAGCRARVENAESAANRFFAAYPRSPMVSRVRAACAPPSTANGHH